MLDVHGAPVGPVVPGTVFELRLLRYQGSGGGGWSVKRPKISHYHSKGGGELPSSWRNDVIVPFGDRLCWVDLQRGLLLSDVLDEENPGLRFVPLPEDPFFGRAPYRNVCVTACGGAMKFVNIFPRCCCSGAGWSYCRSSHHAYTVHTWTLTTEDMAWVKDGTMDTTQIWAVDRYKSLPLPHVRLEFPVVSLDEPHAICFVVCEDHHVKNGDKTTWRIMVDMRSVTLRSAAFRYPEERWHNAGYRLLVPSRVSDYFNSEPSSSGSKIGVSQAGTVPNSVHLCKSIFTGDDLGRS
nr:unnamed protein product [Digitaria exilis]